jgi:uncharacterized protein
MPSRQWAVVRVVAVAVLLYCSTASGRAETPIPPPPSAWVTDTVGLLSAQTLRDQNARLREYERKTGHQVLVYILPTTSGVPIEDWAVRAFGQWKVGRKGLDDGLALFIVSRDRTLRIEVGYGLEARVPDVLASRIIRNTIAPALREGQPDRGVTEGIDQILQLTGDGASSPNGAEVGGGDAVSTIPLGPVQLVFIGLILLALGIVAIRSPWLALMLLVNIFGGRGGGFSGEGGFSGAGGRSGGGGASGRW